jgi:hypothetical protein
MMELKIAIPESLHEGETLVTTALEDLGAMRLSGREWRYDGILKSPSELRAKLEDKLKKDYGKDKQQLAGQLEISS